MMKRTYIHNARIVNEGQTFEGSLVIEGEMIAEILKADETPATPCEETIDAQGSMSPCWRTGEGSVVSRTSMLPPLA